MPTSELELIVNIAAALSAAFVGGIVARRLGLPTLVGYLLAGVPSGLSRRGSSATRKQSASSPNWA